MGNAVLVLNAGSSSIKFALFEVSGAGSDPTLLLRGQIEGIGVEPRFRARDASGAELPIEGGGPADVAAANHGEALTLLLDWLRVQIAGVDLLGVGHRVVHGGMHRAAPERITPRVIEELAALAPLAPHHQPHNVAAIKALAARMPGLPQVACFDTAFHATQPAVARRFGLPRTLWNRGVRRYGFHGISYEYVAHALPTHTGGPLPDRLVVAHLGNGASMCAIREGRSVATTMGFSTLDGLPMGTRCGALDPGVTLYLMREHGMDLPALTDLLYNQSGLLGISGLSSDMRTLLASDNPRAKETVEFFCYRIVRELGSLAAALGGLDALVFTGGIGEHASPVRTAVCGGGGWLGIELDTAANAAGGPLITQSSSKVKAWVIATNEELMIARDTHDLLKQEGIDG